MTLFRSACLLSKVRAPRSTRGQGVPPRGILPETNFLLGMGTAFLQTPSSILSASFSPPSAEPVAADADSAADVVIVTVGDLSSDMDGIPKIEGEPPQGLNVGALHFSESSLLQEGPQALARRAQHQSQGTSAKYLLVALNGAIFLPRAWTQTSEPALSQGVSARDKALLRRFPIGE